MPIHFTDDPDDMRLVNEDPLSFLVAMLLDQQFPIAAAFQGPNKLIQRLREPNQASDRLDPGMIAAIEPEAFVALASAKPGIHRFPKAMAGRIQALCAAIAADYGGDAAAIWLGARSASEVAGRLAELPGFGPEKVKITIATLVKRFDCVLPGWEAVAAPFDDAQPRSVADIGGPDDFAAVKAWKKQQKARGLDKDGSALSS